MAEYILNLPDKPFHVCVKRYRKNRSLAQNSIMWLWINCIRTHIIESTGKIYSDDDIHEHLKHLFLPTRAVEIGGKASIAPKSTARLTTVEMRDYLEAIDMYCANDLGLQLPHPEDLMRDVA